MNNFFRSYWTHLTILIDIMHTSSSSVISVNSVSNGQLKSIFVFVYNRTIIEVIFDGKQLEKRFKSVRLSVRPFPSFHLSICPSINLSVCRSAYLLVCPPDFPSELRRRSRKVQTRVVYFIIIHLEQDQDSDLNLYSFHLKKSWKLYILIEKKL